MRKQSAARFADLENAIFKSFSVREEDRFKGDQLATLLDVYSLANYGNENWPKKMQ